MSYQAHWRGVACYWIGYWMLYPRCHWGMVSDCLMHLARAKWCVSIFEMDSTLVVRMFVCVCLGSGECGSTDCTQSAAVLCGGQCSGQRWPASARAQGTSMWPSLFLSSTRYVSLLQALVCHSVSLIEYLKNTVWYGRCLCCYFTSLPLNWAVVTIWNEYNVQFLTIAFLCNCVALVPYRVQYLTMFQ